MPRPGLHRLTVRTRATLLATALTGVTLLVASVVLMLTLQSHLTSGADALARSRVQDLLELAASGDLPPTLTTLDDEGVAQVVGADGRVLAASHNVSGRPRIASLEPAPGAAPVVSTVNAPDDSETETYRLWAGSGPGVDGPVTIYVGSSLESVHEASHALRTALMLGAPAVMLLLALGTWLVLGSALRRVDRLRIEVDAITEDRLHRRVPAGTVDDEVGRLARTMNTLLARLDAAQVRQQSFVADVSHDLQSPLAAQRAQLEVALVSAGQSAATTELATDLLGSTAEMERLVRDLLFLATADADSSTRPAPTALDLDDLVLEEAARARAGSAVRVETAGVSAAPASAHRDEVRRIVRNLLDNAVAHASSTVVLRAWCDEHTAYLSVHDDGPGVPEADRQRIFERFYRSDAARSRRSGGSGLGLAIARTLAERQGGSLELEESASGAEFLLCLPVMGS
jgi:signal transduction histidine kinase